MITLADKADAAWSAVPRTSGGDVHDVYRYGVKVGYLQPGRGCWVGWRFGTRYEHEDFRVCCELVAFGVSPMPTDEDT